MLLSAVDIGSNAVRLLFSNVKETEGVVVAEKLSLVRIPLRLGEDVFATGTIPEGKISKLIKTMQAFLLLIEVNGSERTRIYATAAMREAVNASQVIAKVRESTGVNIEVIDGIKEAALISSVDGFFPSHRPPDVIFLDVGGGSSEITVMKNRKLVKSYSFKIGTVRMLNHAVDASAWKQLRQTLQSFTVPDGQFFLVGSGGNIAKLVKLYGNTRDKVLTYKNLSAGIRELESMAFSQRMKELGLRPDRADVIAPAGQIFRFVMNELNVSSVYVPKIGLADGMVSQMYKEHRGGQ